MTTRGDHQFATNGLHIYQTTTNNRPCWIYPYREVEESVSFEYILVVLRALRNTITNSRGLVLPPWEVSVRQL